MNFDYNEEQQLLADSVRRYLQKEYDFEKRKASVEKGASDAVWAAFAEMGLAGLPISTEHGGFGGGAVDLMSVMEAFGEALVVEPYLPTMLGALAVAKGGSDKQKQDILPAVAQGKLRLALGEPGAGRHGGGVLGGHALRRLPARRDRRQGPGVLPLGDRLRPVRHRRGDPRPPLGLTP